MSDLYADLIRAADRHDLLPAGSGVVAAVSGGPDSMALLALLTRLRRDRPLTIWVAHVHHGLRGTDADADAELVRRWCDRHSLPYFEKKVDLAQLATLNKTGLEEAGRQVRLEFFFHLRELMHEQHPSIHPIRIALGHHQDDQAETILMHLGRGSGLEGLVGMKPLTEPFVRPFLNFRRQELTAWIDDLGISWRQDFSNLEPEVLRNRLRLQLVPLWQEILGYDPVPLLARAADHVAPDLEYLQDRARQAYNALLQIDQTLDCQAFNRLHRSMQYRVMRLFYSDRTGILKNLTSRHLDRLRQVALSDSPQDSCTLPGGLQAIRIHNRLDFSPAEGSEVPRVFCGIPLQIPGRTLPAGHSGWLEAVFVEYPDEFVYNGPMLCLDEGAVQQADDTICLDAEILRQAIVRNRRPGDRIRPIGRHGSCTLKKYMNERHIPVGRRKDCMLVALGSRIIWFPGFTADESAVARSGRCVRLIWHAVGDKNPK